MSATEVPEIVQLVFNMVVVLVVMKAFVRGVKVVVKLVVVVVMVLLLVVLVVRKRPPPIPTLHIPQPSLQIKIDIGVLYLKCCYWWLGWRW